MKNRALKLTLMILAVIIVFGGGWLALVVYNMNQVFGGGCGVSVGPCRGESINIDLDTVQVDQYIEIPNGKFAFTNTKDTLPPILVKTNESSETEWAIRLITNTDSCSIPLYEMSSAELYDDEYGLRIGFFNSTYMEPGKIYLTDSYDFEWMCLSPM